jgi:hypothetical protein
MQSPTIQPAHCAELIPSDEHNLFAAPIRKNQGSNISSLSSAGSDPNSSTSQETKPHTYFLDSIHTGTPNKLVYATVAHQHGPSPMRSYNFVIFAYNQTASGMTFTPSRSIGGGAVDYTESDEGCI